MAGLVALILSHAGAPRVCIACRRESTRPLASFSPSATPAAFRFHIYISLIQFSPVWSLIGFPLYLHLILQRLLAGCFG